MAAATEPAPPDGRPTTLAPGYGTLRFDPPPAGSYALPPIQLAADSEILLADGRKGTLHALFDQKLVVLSFIYSTCDDVNGCPLAIHVLNMVKQRLDSDPRLGSHVRLVSFSFDPEHDTPSVLSELEHSFAGGPTPWNFATATSAASLDAVLSAYGQWVQRDPGSAKFAHLLRVYLIDRQKQIRNIYSVAFLHRDILLNDIKTLLREEKTGGAPATTAPTPATLGPGDFKGGYESADYQTRSLSLQQRRGHPADLLRVLEAPPNGLPPVPVPPDNPVTAEKVQLGRKLFYDRRLSLNDTFSCAMCHIPEQGFTSNELATAVGIEGRTVRRNAPTLYNVAYFTHLFHDGRENRLEQQVWQPMLNPNEMGNPSIGYVLEKIGRLPDYAGRFREAFGRGPSMETVGMAIASYERTLVSGNSPFDRWRYQGEEKALSAAAKRGFRLFTGKARCATCHRVGDHEALFTDDGFHDTGLGWYATMKRPPPTQPLQVAPGVTLTVSREVIQSVGEPPPSDLGRYEITQDPIDRWRYKTPTLRNVALTAPYMHNGAFGTLQAVVAFYNRGGHPHRNIDPLIRPLGLSENEMTDLVAFLNSLTGDNVGALVADAFAAPIGDRRQ